MTESQRSEARACACSKADPCPQHDAGHLLQTVAQLHSTAAAPGALCKGHTGMDTQVPRMPVRVEIPSAPPPFFFQTRNLHALSQRQ